MGRIRAFFVISLLCTSVAVGLASCGRSENGNSGNRSNSSAQGPAVSSDLDAEKAQALADQTFNMPVVLHVGPDDTDMINKVVAQGSTPYQYESLAPIRPCQQMTYSNDGLPIYARLQGDDNAVLTRLIDGWLQTSGFIVISPHSISYVAPTGGVESENFNCYQVSDRMIRYLFNAPGDIHHGFDVPLVKRICSAWTYANAYETDAPGKGKVKVFAGTFNFTTVPLVPGISTGGSGTYQVKMYLDPDTGNWQSQSQQMSDNTTITWGTVATNDAPISPPSGTNCPGP